MKKAVQKHFLRGRSSPAFGVTAVFLIFGIMSGGPAHSQTVAIGIPDRSFPESVTSTKDGTLYIGSFGNGGIVRVAPGGRTEQFVKPGANDSRSTLGVLADERSHTLYVCSNDVSAFGVAGPSETKGAWLKTFDLATGTAKGSFPVAGEKSLCNDIAVGGDGTVYLTDSYNPNVYSLKPGGTALDVWASNPVLTPPKDRIGLDGIAIGSDGNLYVTVLNPGKLFKITVKDGKAGEISDLKLSRPLERPDAIRAFRDSFLLVEGAGRLDRIKVNGDEAQVDTIQDGFTEPVSATQIGDKAWVAEGRLSYLIGANKTKDPGPFILKAVTLPE